MRGSSQRLAAGKWDGCDRTLIRSILAYLGGSGLRLSSFTVPFAAPA
jgi:hypothetical protein